MSLNNRMDNNISSSSNSSSSNGSSSSSSISSGSGSGNTNIPNVSVSTTEKKKAPPKGTFGNKLLKGSLNLETPQQWKQLKNAGACESEERMYGVHFDNTFELYLQCIVCYHCVTSHITLCYTILCCDMLIL